MSGGFQNRDIGFSAVDDDYGPSYGIDYARYSDVPDYASDERLKESIITLIMGSFQGTKENFEVSVRNGFVFGKFWNLKETERSEIKSKVLELRGVRDFILQVFH